MDSDIMDDPVFDDFENESDVYSPEPKPKAKAAAVKKAAAPRAAPKAAPKKMTQTTLKTKPVSKKRPKPESDGDDDALGDGDSILSHTPPSNKKPKKAPAAKKAGSKPLAEIENDSMMQLDGATESRPSKSKTATETYQKLTPLEHIIKRPDTYIGSVEHAEQQMWIYNKETQLMESKKVSFVPGLYKIFDEILVNAADNKQRDSKMSYIKVTINRELGEISVENDGRGIPVEIHDTEGIYIPEMVFGHLLTGSNYDDDEKKTVGGRNGYGAKLCNVFSTEFTLECQDSQSGKRYRQTWTDNMSKMGKAKITSNKAKDFVRVTFKPDFKRFGMPDGIDEDLEGLMCRRVYDMAGCVEKVKVYLNGEQLKVDFKKYCEMYAKAIAQERDDVPAGEVAPPATVLFEDNKTHPRWQIGFTVSDGSFQQVSFVNSIATTSGGTHVNYIADQICTALLKDLSKRMKGHSLKAHHVRNHIFIFVNCFVDNPAFTSQTKEQMTTKLSAFGSKCVLTDGFIKKIRATEAIDNILHFAEKKADKMLAKSDGNKRSRISNDKLVDANLAGTRHGHECTLILTEGDSARGLAVAGRAILDPDRIGVFPLRGKMLNVRDASIDQITKNREIQNIKQFLGLKHKQVYTDTKSLRYGHLMIMADQDHDGSHIKGLLINFLQVQFPSLLHIPDFFREFVTPVVKVWQGPNPKKPLKLKSFFTMPQYEEWKEAHEHEIKRWHSKYYKGLGTSSNADAQVYFTNLDEHLKEFNTMRPEEAELFDLAFSKKKADARKEWLGNFVPGTYLDHSTKSITYTDFVNRELILFSMADNMRSIPSVLDGLKPGQRKVMYACFKRNLVKDQKVIELAGYVSEQTSYHHGEVSLQQTIVGLAQDFVGSNNVNCLEPSGNFGSRLAGGSDAASARYIYTRLSPFARKVFSVLDEPNLEAQYEDGKMIEPKVYVPVIPMVLVNGADGIGTGWSTSIPNYNPIEIVTNLKRRMGRLEGQPEEEPFQPMVPWWRGWKGTPESDGTGRYKFNGIAFQDDKNPNEVIVTELPIRVWTDDFKSKLEEIIRAEKSPSFIKDYKEFNDHKNVHFVIQMEEKHMKAALEEGLLDRFKLTKAVNTTNLVAFDTRGQIHKYERVEDILEEYYHYRLQKYAERKSHWLKVYHADYRKLKNQARFIEEIIEGKLVVSKKKKAVLVVELRERKYEAFPRQSDSRKARSTDEGSDHEEDEEENEGGAADYDYLLSMPIYSLTMERLERLKRQIAAKKTEYDDLECLSEKDLWCRDLDDFVAEWENYLRLDAEIQTSINRMGRRASKKIGAGRGRRPKADDDYNPKPAKAAKVTKVETKTHERFAEMFSGKPKAKPKTASSFGKDGASDFSDDDFAALSKKPAKKAAEPKPAASKPAKTEGSDFDDDDFTALAKPKTVKKMSPEESSTSATANVEEPTIGRAKRAAASKAKTWVVETDSESDDDDKLLGDVGDMVRGIGQPASDATNNRLSLFAMARPESSHGNGSLTASVLPKSKAKPTKAFDLESGPDDTNYEMLARSSPQKAKEDVDSFLSDDDDLPAVKRPAAKASKASSAAAAKPAAAAAPVKKARGRPAVAASKGKAAPAPKAKAALQLSPAAKAYAAKKAKPAKKAFSDEDEDEDAVQSEDSAPPVARARGRPARAAAAAKPKPIYVDDDEEDDSLIVDDKDDDDNDSDVYDMDDSD